MGAVREKGNEMITVKNFYGVDFSFEVADMYMDDDLREELHAEGFDTEQAFFDAYCEAHEERYGEGWELAKENPVF